MLVQQSHRGRNSVHLSSVALAAALRFARLSPILLGAATLAAPSAAQACKCMMGTDPVAARDNAELVLLVRAASGPTTKKATDGGYSWEIHEYKFEVVARFKGDLKPKATVLITTDASSASCGRSYESGGEYLLFASKSQDGRWTDNACSYTRTRAIAEEKGDFARLGPDLDAVLPASMFEGKREDPSNEAEPRPDAPIDPYQPGETKEPTATPATDPDSTSPVTPPSSRGCSVAAESSSAWSGAHPELPMSALLLLVLSGTLRRRRD